ncbi:DUF7284 family protein [Haloarchaeobius sp. HRN-SO-5]|uniref:DUF7284 family protein n=1 Tax=Haloarchaeobius sp. HRN-SO-5 TaxID=3446118 RepID=UPI003EBB9327
MTAPPALDSGDRRAVSTVLDVAVCLLFVTASVAVLVDVDRPTVSDPSSADRAASLLGTTTATVAYSPTGTTDLGNGAGTTCASSNDSGDCRTAHGSLASLLARAAVSEATVDGTRISATSGGFERAVSNATARRLAVLETDWQVVATWRAYPDAPLAGSVVVGDDPRPGVDVHAATLSVPVAVGRSTGEGRAGEVPTGVDSVARDAARATVGRLFPPERTRLALLGSSPDDRLTAARYRRTAATLGVGLTDTVESGATERANAYLVDALAARYAADMRERTDGPADAAASVSPRTVTVTVRTWST